MTAQLPSSKEQLLADIAHAEEKAATLCGPCADDHARLAGYLRSLLAAHEQEPVAYMCDGDDGREYNGHNEFSCGERGIPLYTHPAPVPAVQDDYFASLVVAARLRAEKAMRKFPQPNYVLNKLAEESGEVIKAVIHYTEGREVWSNVEGEIIDNLAMLMRLVTEGDQVIGFTPPDSCLVAAPKGV